MGHRALVAYERPTDGYTVRYSHWGARGYLLLSSITESTPLGGRPDEDGDHPAVRAAPLGVAEDLADVAASFVDPLCHEAAFVVDDDFDVRAFEPLAFWQGPGTPVHGGALVELRADRDPGEDARELRAWRRGALAALAALQNGDGADGDDGGVDDENDDSDATAEAEAPDEALHAALFDALRADTRDRTCHPIPPVRDHDDSDDGATSDGS